MDYILHIAVLILIYSILSISLNVLMGYAGQLSIAHGAFFGMGAYGTALLTTHTPAPFLLSLLAISCIVGAVGAFLALPAIRIRGDYFAVSTFGLQVIAFHIFNNARGITGGPSGFTGVPSPDIFGIKVEGIGGFFLLYFLIASLITLFCLILVRSPFGRILKAIREDELWAQTLGKNVAIAKVTVFSLTSAIAAVGGVLYAHYFRFIDPTSFTVMESVFIITIIIVGGAGNLWGSILGTIFLLLLPEGLRLLNLPDAIAANVQQILYGLILMGVLLLCPQGLLGDYSFQDGK